MGKDIFMTFSPNLLTQEVGITGFHWVWGTHSNFQPQEILESVFNVCICVHMYHFIS